MNPFYSVVAARADFRCEYCHAPQNAFNFGFEVEDIYPRRDAWEQHFAFAPELNHVVGLTAVGRVTMTRLKMNSLFQIRARLHWISMELYP